MRSLERCIECRTEELYVFFSLEHDGHCLMMGSTCRRCQRRLLIAQRPPRSSISYISVDWRDPRSPRLHYSWCSQATSSLNLVQQALPNHCSYRCAHWTRSPSTSQTRSIPTLPSRETFSQGYSAKNE